MLIDGFPTGAWQANCYVLAPAPDGPALVVDPGQDALADVERIVLGRRLQPEAVLLTHGHIDHIWGVVEVCEAYDIPAYIHPADRAWLADPLDGISGQTRAMLLSTIGADLPGMEPSDVRLLDEGGLRLAGLDLVITHAPGHSPGSVLTRIGDVLLSGDVLFVGSIGRTDLPGGDHEVMLRTLATRVLSLSDDLTVLPGHGAGTTIGDERRTNPFLLALQDQPA